MRTPGDKNIGAIDMDATLQTGAGTLDFVVRRERFAVYDYGEGRTPGFSALLAPGRRRLSPESGPAMWAAHADVAGVSFGPTPSDPEDRPCGRVVSARMTARRGSQSVGFEHSCDWIGPDGRCLMRDTRLVRVTPGPSEGVILDVTLHLFAPAETPVRLGKSDSGLLHLRAASALVPSGGGQIRNSLGEYGFEKIDGRSAAWCACVGVVDEKTAGFVLMDHPENPWFPSPWIARPDGTLSPSPFPWRSVEIAPHTPLTLRYRLMTYVGYVDSGWADARLNDWASASERS